MRALGSLHQDAVFFLQESGQRGNQSFTAFEVPAAFSRSPAHLTGAVPAGKDEVDPLLPCIVPDIIVHLQGIFSEFQHISQDTDVPSGRHEDQIVDPIAYRIRVGVVTVIHHCDARREKSSLTQ